MIKSNRLKSIKIHIAAPEATNNNKKNTITSLTITK